MGAFPFSQPMPTDENDELRQQLKYMGGCKCQPLESKYLILKLTKMVTMIEFITDQYPNTMGPAYVFGFCEDRAITSRFLSQKRRLLITINFEKFVYNEHRL